MRTIPVLLPDDLHKQFRLKLFQDDRTSKEFFLTAVRVYVEGDTAGPKKEDEKPPDPNPAIEERSVDDPIEPESEDKKPKEKTGHEKKQRTRRNQPRGKEKNGDKGTATVPGEKKGGGGAEPGAGKKRGLWPWNR